MIESEVLNDEADVASDDKRHRAFPHINQFRNTVKTVRERSGFEKVELPVLTFVGSVKLHGTNAGITYTEDGEMLPQSRSQILSVGNDNAGFAAYVADNSTLFQSVAKPNRTIYGEWCGGSIQKSVALNKLPKMFVPFAIRDGDQWLDPQQIMDISPIKTIYHFPHWFKDIDFNCPETSQNMLVTLTTNVEYECPVGRDLGVIGVGEGIVWWPMSTDKFNIEGLAFKVKGEKHSETKVKTLAAVDIEKLESVRALVESIVTENRLEQRLIQSGIGKDIKNTGTFIKLVSTDVMREEADTIEASGIPLADVTRGIQLAAKNWWMKAIF